MSAPRRVVITGAGVVSPFGAGREQFWQQLLAGRSALRWLSIPQEERHLWPDDAAGAPAPLTEALPEQLRSRGREDLLPLLAEPVIHHALVAAQEAVADAGLSCPPERLGCVIGTSKGGVHSLHRLCAGETFPDWWTLAAPSGPAVAVASLMNAQGAVLTPVTACATGLSCLVRAVELIQTGQCDAVLAGSADASLTPAVIASFRRLGVTARGFADPQSAVKPCDRSRNGFLVGEGAAVFVLEAADRVPSGSGRAYAEWIGGGMVSDAAGLTQLDPQPDALIRLIGDVLQRGMLVPEQLDFISLHGTATRVNDAVEVRAIRSALGPHADRVAAAAIKGAIGHLLGAAGSVELAALLLALRDQIHPPTVGLADPDPDCRLPLTLIAAHRPMTTALKLSLGFGGHLVAALLKKGDRPAESNPAQDVTGLYPAPA